MIDEAYTQRQLSAFVRYLTNVWESVKSGAVSDKDNELGRMFARYANIHNKCAEARKQLRVVYAELQQITDKTLKDRLRLVFELVEDLTRFLDNAEEGSFRNLFFQAEHRQARAFLEIERRVDALANLAGRIASVFIRNNNNQ